MGLEGAVKLGLRRELELIADERERAERLEQLVAHAHEHAKALNAATLFELDDVIDPADTRALIVRTLRAAPRRDWRAEEPRRFVDTW
jgi:acetyl-CoA carboxylase carboxyltransferase component